MLELNDAQKNAVKAWVAEGAGISDVQNRIIEEFRLRPTYMDVRLLVLDLGATVKDRQPPVKADLKAAASPPAADAPADEAGNDEFADEAGEPAPPLPLPNDKPAGAGAVTVEVDRLMKPGALVSGTVVFSDGVKAQWSLDQYGRLGLSGAKPGYRPSPSDVQEFQLALQKALARQGY